ncbi:MAG: acylphosphatase [Halanaerobium sp.]|nr:acylphosphatase [Halanaerobium sp.]
MSDKKAVEVRVIGRVHGVGFRSTTHQKATKLGLTGFVRNAGVNEVEIYAEGDEDKLQEFIDYIESFPSSAQVEETSIDWKEYSGSFPRFMIKYKQD